MGDRLGSGARLAAAGAAMALGWLAVKARTRAEDADLWEQVALVTGGSRGLGLAISRELVRQGCRVAICARDEAELELARDALKEGGGDVLAVPCDVADREQVAAMVAEVTRYFGQIDILVNNAGIITVAPLEALTYADFERVMNVNFWGVLNTTLAVLPGMRARGSGRIANITSIGGKLAVPHLLPYSCAKFAAVGFSEGLRAELAESGISVTTVVPGLMRTGSFLHAEFGGDQEGEYRWFAVSSSAPYPVTIGADRAARIIVRAVRRGQADCTFPLSADVAGRLSGLLPGAMASMLSLADQLLPRAEGRAPHMTDGAAIQRRHDTPLLRAATMLGRSAAQEYHQSFDTTANSHGEAHRPVMAANT